MTAGFEGVDPEVLRRLLTEARQEIDALKSELVRLRSVRQAEARQQHPAQRDWCDPNGLPRPKLTVVR